MLRNFKLKLRFANLANAEFCVGLDGGLGEFSCSISAIEFDHCEIVDRFIKKLHGE